MTVVSAMRFNKEEGALVADEQISDEENNRKYSMATKAFSFQTDTFRAALGIAGNPDFFMIPVRRIMKEMQTNKHAFEIGEAFAHYVSEAFVDYRRDHINRYLMSNHGVQLEELEHFDEENGPAINKETINTYNTIVNGKHVLNNFFIGAGLSVVGDTEDVAIYQMNPYHPIPQLITRPYEVIGGGYDTADEILYSFVKDMSRKARENISPIEGLAALIHATREASERNLGVEGSPQVIIIKGKEIIEVDDNNARMASDVVAATNAELLPRQFQDAMLQKLLYENIDFKDVNEAMFKHTKDKQYLDLTLRGYKL